MFLASSSSVISAISSPLMAWMSSLSIPIFLAIALAVTMWSPVIITVFIPPFLQSLTREILSSCGGSLNAISPANIIPSSKSLISGLEGISFKGLYATAITRIPSSAKSSTAESIVLFSPKLQTEIR